jgi:hypothetical protein
MSHEAPENPILKLLAVPFLIVLGLFCLAGAFIPGARQWLDAWIGDVNFIYLGLGFLFFYMAVLVSEKNLMRRKFLGLLDEIQQLFLGQDYREISQAVEILIGAIRNGDEKAQAAASNQLKRMTGKDFGNDPNRWSEWWAKHRVHFLTARQRAHETEGSDSS